MKIGIITLHYNFNYGAVLQLAAMQKVLKNLGHEPIAINYLPQNNSKPKLWHNWGIRSGLRDGNMTQNIRKRWVELLYYDKVKSRFQKFCDDYLNISTACYTNKQFQEVVMDLDAIITGSDQVWHFKRPSCYFLNWGYPFNGLKISYAASCGFPDQPKSRYQDVSSWIQDFDHISVRDQISHELIRKVSGRTPEIVADPTLLTDLVEFGNEVQTPDKYIFVYILGSEIKGGHVQMIAEIRKRYGNLPVVALVASAHKPQLIKWADHIIWNGGPAEWLYLVTNATFVYTDSYHCGLFSMKNETPFLAYYAEKIRAPRLIDIITRYDLHKSITESVEHAVNNKFWEQTHNGTRNTKVKQHIENSINFLNNSLANSS